MNNPSKMKKIAVLLLTVIALSSCKDKEQGITTDIIKNPTGSGEEMDMPVITFKEERIDFGTITEGEKVTKVFEFTNTGKSDLVISNVTASCGCTVPSNWPKTPVAPGEGGKIEVTFNSEGKPGQQVKQITILANTSPASTVVAIAGEVNRPGVE